MKDKGFTLVETLVALAILMVVFTALAISCVTAQRLWMGGFIQIAFQSRGRVVLEQMAGDLRSSTGATALNNGDRIRFVTDPNRTPQTASDDITSEYYLSNTDIMYDPDITIAGDEISVLRSANREGAIPVFQMSGDLVVITFRLLSNNILYGTKWSSMATSIKMRNV
ncbi:MAG: prepilin-type N-terminal cleavage/methylation domain-containing protein [Candidatus Omnitrophica bacterium]|nr:prepilin-type N-terminal cleavage/methylation domain-containing protein [Candidatus Omnitrophota bacterium]MBU4457921.1 prepilin-type N-terminal cleavage/methylation domain-containing protein [Candidatus Omnitrophota bacterium]